jgi:predicted nuclease of predicted toxin-antitoxin system
VHILAAQSLTRIQMQALWRKNQQDDIEFLEAARGPDIVAIEQDKSTSFIIDASPVQSRSSRLSRPLKCVASTASHPESAAAAKIFSAGESSE